MNLVDYLLGSLLIVFAIILIAVVLLQEGRRKGLSGTIAGGAETFLSRGKARALDALLTKWTKYIAIIFFLLILVLNAINFFLK